MIPALLLLWDKAGVRTYELLRGLETLLLYRGVLFYGPLQSEALLLTLGCHRSECTQDILCLLVTRMAQIQKWCPIWKACMSICKQCKTQHLHMVYFFSTIYKIPVGSSWPLLKMTSRGHCRVRFPALSWSTHIKKKKKSLEHEVWGIIYLVWTQWCLTRDYKCMHCLFGGCD